jgi:hypothetical protein
MILALCSLRVSVTSLYQALGLSSSAVFVPVLRQCAKDLGLVLDDADFALRWQRNMNSGPRPRGCGSSRPFRMPTAEALWPYWELHRDAAWLYSRNEYVWDSIGCSAYESNDTVRRGIDDGYNARGITPTRILDMGAGPGFTTLMLARAFPKAHVHHVDCNIDLNRMFDWFNKNYAKLSNAVHVDKPVGQYDLVVCVEFLEHLECIGKPKVGDPMRWIDNDLQNILAAGGRLMMHSNWSAEQAGWLTLGHFLDYTFDGAIVSNRRPHQVANAYRKAMQSRGWRIDFNPTNRSKAPKLWIR